MRSLAFLFVLAACISAATVDRLAVTVGRSVITELQIDEDLRVAALLNGQPIKRDLDSRRAAADRLIQQMLIQHEIEMSGYPMPSTEDINTLYSKVQEDLGGAERLQSLLVQYAVTEKTLRAHLTAQLVTLGFIEFRFRPDVNVTDDEIDAALRRQNTTAVASTAPHAKPDSAQRAQMAQALTEERTDAALNTWLAETRKQVEIVYLDSSLQ